MTKLKTFESFNNSDLSGKSSIGFDLFERMSDLSDSFKSDLMLIAEKGIICGSTAHYLHGKLNRLPNDIDVISDSKLLESLSGEILEGSESKPKHKPSKSENISGVDVPHQILYALAAGSDSPEAFVENLAYHIAQTIPGFTSSNFTKAENKRMSSLFDYLKPDTHESATTFKYLGSKKSGHGTQVCVFEASGDVDHVTMTIFGRAVRVESLSQVEKYRKSFGRISESLGDYEEWEGDVITELEDMLDVTTSDAQGIIMGQDAVMQDCWSNGMSAKDTAVAIDKASAVGEGEDMDNDDANSDIELDLAVDYIIDALKGKKIEQSSDIATEFSKYIKSKNYRFEDFDSYKDALSDVITNVKNRLNQDIVDDITALTDFKQRFGEPTVGKEWRIDFGAPGKGYAKYVVKKVQDDKVYSDKTEDTSGELDVADVI